VRSLDLSLPLLITSSAVMIPSLSHYSSVDAKGNIYSVAFVNIEET
jgi:hypothetical protein